MKPVETKQVECLKCGWIGKVVKYIPLKFHWCGSCGALGYNLRLYPSKKKKEKML